MTITATVKAAVVTTFIAITLAVGSGVAAAGNTAPAIDDAQVTATNPWE